MVFSSPIFLFIFLPLVLFFYYILPWRFRNILLLMSSLIFYAWGEKRFVFVMMLSICVNYLCVMAMGRAREENRPDRFVRLVFILALVFNLGLLFYYKYINFIVYNLNERFLPYIGIGSAKIVADNVHLPIGISFFTFQILSYVIDVYRQEIAYSKSLINVGLYISLFPQLIAGPIVRYHDIASQIVKRFISLDKFAAGAKRFIVGLAKKVLIGNTAGYTANNIFSISTGQLTTGSAWLGVICYALQIYFDFSGYSDMAIGLGRMFGFDLLENFNYPYISRSITEFWRRWHISLSTWFRDYLYIPLGGNRHGAWRTYFNLLTVFVLCGLWHGASWNFLIWGLYYGAFLVLERLGFRYLLSRLWAPLQHMYAMLVVLIGWVIFRSPGMGYCVQYIKLMFGMLKTSGIMHAGMFANNLAVLVLIAGIIFSLPVWNYIAAFANRIRPGAGERLYGPVNYILTLSHGICLLVIFIFCIMSLAVNSYNPFIYYRF